MLGTHQRGEKEFPAELWMAMSRVSLCICRNEAFSSYIELVVLSHERIVQEMPIDLSLYQ
jgi:hypothetical protein